MAHTGGGRPTEPAGEDSLAEAVMGAARTLRRRWSAGLAPWDLSPHQGRALRVVGRHQPTRLGVVAEHLRIAPRSATEVVDGLEARGLLRRLADPTDRRAVLVELTDDGTRVLGEIDSARSQGARDYFSALGPREQAQLARLLHKLNP